MNRNFLKKRKIIEKTKTFIKHTKFLGDVFCKNFICLGREDVMFSKKIYLKKHQEKFFFKLN
jgi:hypothetical protein